MVLLLLSDDGEQMKYPKFKLLERIFEMSSPVVEKEKGREKSDRPYYINKKGIKIDVKISFHSSAQFQKRYETITGKVLTDDLLWVMTQEFNAAYLVTNLDKHYRKRLRRYGEDTLFFKKDSFVFVVQNAVIKTVEIAENSKRDLNTTWRQELNNGLEEVGRINFPD
jgi:hypothetical protein